MKTIIPILLAAALLVASFFLGRNLAKKGAQAQIEQLERTTAAKDSIIADYDVQVARCLAGIGMVRDSLSREIEDIIKSRPTIITRPGQVVVRITTEDETLKRIEEWLKNPQ